MLLSDALEVKDHSSPNSILHQRKFFSKDHFSPNTILHQTPFFTKDSSERPFYLIFGIMLSDQEQLRVISKMQPLYKCELTSLIISVIPHKCLRIWVALQSVAEYSSANFLPSTACNKLRTHFDHQHTVCNYNHVT